MQEETYSVVRQALEESGLSPDRLELEITESALIGQHEKVSLVADAFKSLGISWLSMTLVPVIHPWPT